MRPKRLDGPWNTLTFFLVDLTFVKPVQDIRGTHPDVPRVLPVGQNFLLTETQLWQVLCDGLTRRGLPRRRTSLGQTYDVARSTVLLTIPRHRHAYRLVWKEREKKNDYGYRILTEQEQTDVADLFGRLAVKRIPRLP